MAYVLPEMSLRCSTMKVEILYFDGCPIYKATEKILREVIAEEGMDAEIKLVAVNTDEEAQRIRFTGSPTIKVNSEDLFPIPDWAEYALGCRMYATPEGLVGYPTAEMLSEALRNFGECDTCELRRTPLWRSSVRMASPRSYGLRRPQESSDPREVLLVRAA
jgi:hypothetical protein